MFCRNLFLLGLTAAAQAAQLTVSIAPSQGLPNPATLPSSTHAILLGPAGVVYDVPLRRDSAFVFQDVADASYLLTVHSREYFFPPLRIDVGKSTPESTTQDINAWQTFRGNEWSNKGPSYGSGKDELKVNIMPSGQKDYYQPRGGFNVLSFLKSPMILMALVSVAMIFGLPYLMENMDPETKAEFEEMQKKSPLTGEKAAVNAVQNFDLAGWMAGSGTSGKESSGNKRK